MLVHGPLQTRWVQNVGSMQWGDPGLVQYGQRRKNSSFPMFCGIAFLSTTLRKTSQQMDMRYYCEDRMFRVKVQA